MLCDSECYGGTVGQTHYKNFTHTTWTRPQTPLTDTGWSHVRPHRQALCMSLQTPGQVQMHTLGCEVQLRKIGHTGFSDLAATSTQKTYRLH